MDSPGGWRGVLAVAAAIAAIVGAVAGALALIPAFREDDDPSPTTSTAVSPTSGGGGATDGSTSSSAVPSMGEPGFVAYASRPSGASRAFVLDVATGTSTPVWDGRAVAGPSVSADGGTVAAVVEADEGVVIAVGPAATDRPRTFEVEGEPSATAISPDGARVAFVTDQRGHDDIALLDVEDGHVELVSDGSADETDPAWSADGARIVYVRAGSRDDEIVVAAADGGGSGAAALQVEGRARSPWFTPDGGSVAYVGDVGGSPDALVRPLDGDDVENASESVDAEIGLVVLGDGRLVTAAPDRGLLLLDPAGGADPVVLTRTPGDTL